jgi:hypothetical protein
MSVGRFDRELPLPRQGRVPVKGPFKPQDRAVNTARVLFLIVQGEGEVDRRGKRVGGEGTGTLKLGLARGIALSVVVKPGSVFDRGRKFDPPAIETLTWCADFKFVEP